MKLSKYYPNKFGEKLKYYINMQINNKKILDFLIYNHIFHNNLS
jgi:hypothetical protein